MREEGAEALAELALEHVRVPVAVRAERRRRVVDVQRAQPVEPDPVVDLGERRRHGVRIADVDSRDVEVAGVEADAEPRVAVERVDERRELVDRAADRAAGAGRVLEQEPRLLGAAVEHLRGAPARTRFRPASKPAPRCEPTWKTTPSASIATAASTVERIVATLLA